MPTKTARPVQISAGSNRRDEEKAFFDLTPEERQKCERFWLKFKILERLQFGALLIPLLAFWAFPSLEARMPRFLGLAFITVFVVCHIWLYSLDCPRCSATFSGGLIALLPRVNYPWKCYGCDLGRRELKYIAHLASDLN
jgi:hypothetical protein